MNKKTFKNVKVIILFLLMLLISSCRSEYFLTNENTSNEFVNELNALSTKDARITLTSKTEVEAKFLLYEKYSISIELKKENRVTTAAFPVEDIYKIRFSISNGPKGAAIGFVAGAIIDFATEFVTGAVSNNGPHPDKGASFMFGGFIDAGLGIIFGNIFYDEDIFYFQK